MQNTSNQKELNLLSIEPRLPASLIDTSYDKLK